MNFKHIAFYLIIASISTSCVSNYALSTNAYAPTTKEHYTPDGKSIPTASVSYKNQFTVDESVSAVVLKSNLAQKVDVNSLVSVAENNSTLLLVSNLLDEAKTYLGTPYRYGGTTRNGIDCSAFTQRVFGQFNIELPRVAFKQAQAGDYLSKEDLRKGDLIFFSTRGRGISHVGIVDEVDENGQIFFIHASSSRGVAISSLEAPYWNARFRYGKRVI